MSRRLSIWTIRIATGRTSPVAGTLWWIIHDRSIISAIDLVVFNTGEKKPEPVFMESILVAFLRQLGVQDELRRSLDSGLFFTGHVPLKMSQHGLKYSNITLNQSLVGKKKFPWKVAFGIEDIHVFTTPPSPIGGIWTNGRKFTEHSPSNGQWHEFPKIFDAHIKLSPGEGADLWSSASSFWVLFFTLLYNR